jgi:hypothetical protein
MWWQALDRTPSLSALCKSVPGLVVYGEVYGAVQDLNYGHSHGEVSFAAFDMMMGGSWLDADKFLSLCSLFDLPTVPFIGGDFPEADSPALRRAIRYDFDRVCRLAEGKTLVPGADHVREGVVVRSLLERAAPGGRAVLKWVGCGYLER